MGKYVVTLDAAIATCSHNICDIEIVFLYPVAVVLTSGGWFALAEFGFFIAILALAYVYIWKKGALEWR